MYNFNVLTRRLFVALAFLISPLFLLAPVTLGNLTLLPVENLISYEPWASIAADFGFTAPDAPHNPLLSDLILENYVWKRFIVQAIEIREIPLWNPYLFSGVPFFASGQHSLLYPFSVIFYLLPLSSAYGWFMLSQYFLAGVLAYVFIRGLGIGRLGAVVGGLTYQLSLFMVVSAVFPMIVAGAIWLPLMLLAVELMVCQRPLVGRPTTLPWMCLGSLAISMQLLAGHPEVMAYSLLITALYAAWRISSLVLPDVKISAVSTQLRRTQSSAPLFLLIFRVYLSFLHAFIHGLQWYRLLRIVAFVAGMVLLGMLLGAVQFVPLLEALGGNFRSGSASLAEVRSWGYPWRRLVTFLIPNFFGNPSHHGYFDVFSWKWEPVSVNALGKPIQQIEWGIKNYVEGGAYVGILPLLLSFLGILASFYGRRTAKRMWHSVLFFTLLALLCLALVFGTPLYAVVYYLPGMAQLHTPFRWVWPFSLCVAVLASWGVESLTGVTMKNAIRWRKSRVVRNLAWGSMFGGTLLLFGLLLARVYYGSVDLFVQGLLSSLALAPETFVDARMFFSYQARWLSQLALLLLASGFLLWKISHLPVDPAPSQKFWHGTVAAVVAFDLLIAGTGFNPSSDPALLEHVPPVVEFLREDTSEWRFTTYDPEHRKPFNANTGWLFNFEDVRGYDSLIPRQYVDYMNLIQPQSELQYNRIGPISDAQALDSPLLDLLNVKYVITLAEIASSKYQLVYNGEVLVYRNTDVTPRAFTLPVGCAFETSDFGASMQQFDPRRHVILDSGTAGLGTSPVNSTAGCRPLPATIIASSPNNVTVDVLASEPVFLLLGDSYAEGWRAYMRPLMADESKEVRVGVLRANGNFRAVHLESGDATVRFHYSPDSVKLGGFTSALAFLTIVLLLSVWLWRLWYRESVMETTARRVAKNSLTPMAFSLVNRAIDLIFAMFYLRVLGPGEAGNYTTAIVIIGWFDIWTNFGLNTWLTREASRDRDHANRYLSNSTVFRLLIGVLTFPLFVGGIMLYQRQTGALGDDTLLAIVLLAVGMLFSSISTGLSALFYAYEKAEYPAVITSVTTLFKVAAGTIVLLWGYGFVGLAGVTILVNAITMIILIVLSWKLFFRPHFELDFGLQRDMVSESFPLMLNHLLATLFFKIDIPMIRTIRGGTEVGRYGTAYKFVDAFNIIPSFFTFALFPIMSRQAITDRPALVRTYHLAIKLLVGTALPLAVMATFLAIPMVGLLGGREFLPDGALALQLMVWSIPFGWINSVTNYLLVALGQQRALTRAFAIAVTFNIVINAIFIPIYGFRAAAVSTILSEIVVGACFQWYIYRHLQRTPWMHLFWRLAAAAGIMVVVTWIGMQLHLILGLLLGGLVYIASSVALGVLDAEERKLLATIVPEALRRPFTVLTVRLHNIIASVSE